MPPEFHYSHCVKLWQYCPCISDTFRQGKADGIKLQISRPRVTYMVLIRGNDSVYGVQAQDIIFD